MSKLNKRIISIIIGIVTISAVIISVIIIKSKNNNENTETSNINIIDNSHKDNYTQPTTITWEELENYKTPIDITTENWKDYVETEDTMVEIKDNFGEISCTEKTTRIKLKDNICGYMVIKTKSNRFSMYDEDKTQTFTWFGGVDKENMPNSISMCIMRKDTTNNIDDYTFTLDELECVKIKAKLYYINIPDELWNKDNDLQVDKYLLNKDDYIRIISQREMKKDNIRR